MAHIDTNPQSYGATYDFLRQEPPPLKFPPGVRAEIVGLRERGYTGPVTLHFKDGRIMAMVYPKEVRG